MTEARVAPISGIKAPPANPEPDRQEWRSESDLQAQWEMAYWAKVAAIAAWIAIVVTGIGIVFIKFTLDATRDAVREAAKSAKASVDAAKAAQAQAAVTEDAFTKLERPYVFLFGVSILEHSDGFPLAKFTAANYGKTPAIIENFRALASVGTKPETPLRADETHPLFSSPIISAEERRDNLEQAVHTPYRSPELFSAPLSQVYPRIDDPTHDLFLWMVINYRGPFTGGHETSACWRYDRNVDRFVQHGHDDYNYEK